ncbi:MAG: MarR family transcriptional regulator [Pseudomonadota bacterium]
MSDLPDHIGWDLVRASRVWLAEFESEVVAAGHPWFAEARGRLVEHIGRDGAEQGAIAIRAGLTKQAVAQHLDSLERDGLIRRETLEGDGRKRRVVWTGQGLRALHDIDIAKGRVEARFRLRLGDDAFRHLRDGLKRIADVRQET